MRFDIIYEINRLVHCLLIKGTCVISCRIPPHCGLMFYEWADTDSIVIIIDNFCIALFSGTQTHCALQHSPTISKFHKHNTYNYDN